MALPGCGRDLDLTQLRVTVRGNFPQTPTVLTGPGSITEVPDEAQGITVEGLVDDNRVEAVGRTARLRLAGRLPVYFAPPESLCAVPSTVTLGLGGGAALDEVGDLLVVGTHQDDEPFSPRIVHAHDLHGEPSILPIQLPVPSVGQTIEAVGRRRFVVVGGAAPAGTLSSLVRIDLDKAVPVSDPWVIRLSGRAHSVAHHASALLNDHGVLVTGGCTSTDFVHGGCTTEDDSVTGVAFIVDADEEPLTARPIADLNVPRFGHDMTVADDGVATVIGGRGVGGSPVFVVEQWHPDRSTWEIRVDLEGAAAGDPIAGGTVLTGGIVVVALESGDLLVIGDETVDRISPEDIPDSDFGRSVLTLQDERVLVDTFVVPVGLLGAEYESRPGAQSRPWQVVNLTELTPGAPRFDSSLVALDDGSVMLVGGANPGGNSGPAFLRYRPPLDGPDEAIPNISALAPGSFVVHHSSIAVEDTPDGPALALRPSDDEDLRVPPVRAHARGFRSRRFEFHVALTLQGQVTPSVVLEYGAKTAWVIPLTDDAEAWYRTSRGGRSLECEGKRPSVEKPLRVEVQPEIITVRGDDGDEEWVCSGPGDVDVAVGLGAAGTGVVWAREFRLIRE